jgi:hypothetical protein
LATGGLPGTGSSAQLPGQPTDELTALLNRQLGLVCRRHFTEIEHIQGIVPGLGRFPLHQVGVQLIQPDVPLLFLRAMTTIAIRFKQWPNALFENRFAIRSPREGRQQALSQRYRDDDQTEKMFHDGKILEGSVFSRLCTLSLILTRVNRVHSISI